MALQTVTRDRSSDGALQQRLRERVYYDITATATGYGNGYQ